MAPLVPIMFDEPQGLPETHGYATSGWNAARSPARSSRVLRGLEPRLDLPKTEQLILANMKPAR